MDILENNLKLINKFKNELNIEGYSDKTIDMYSMYITLFSKFIKKDLITINSDDVIEYLSYLKQEKKAESTTMNLVLSAIKHFYSNFLKIDLELKIKLPKKAKKIPVVLTSKEIILLLENITDLRNKLITQFIFSTGVRISECMEMKYKDLDFNEYTGKVVSGKGNKDRIIILSKKWVEEYKKYLENRQISSEYLFCNSIGKPLSVDTVQKFLKIAAKRAGIDKKVSPHTLRHSFATNLLENDVNIRYIQQLLGHANLNTTQIYTKVNTNKLKIIKNPLDDL
ncbi:MAG: tyrosine-type recombinase/integrase [Candidatus ainarchaeum sp.]|jgi:integrase/recombinase XerD|nr:tyrosine-type recombinase/integrase [Candidatus ainarchaeum sp.]